MELYLLLIEINQQIIMGKEVPYIKQKEAVKTFLKGINNSDEINAFHKKMNADSETKNMYPLFYLPPYINGKKLRLIQGYLPKTNILYSNFFELEIIRLLYLFDKENPVILNMIEDTVNRLKHTCFGQLCTKGECLTTGVSVLRFLAITKPQENIWINDLLNYLGDIFLNIGLNQVSYRKDFPPSYLLMALTDINNEKAKEIIYRKKEWLISLLRRGWLTGQLSNGKISEGDTYNPLIKYIIRNALGILPDFTDIKNHKIYISEVDNRCYCDI